MKSQNEIHNELKQLEIQIPKVDFPNHSIPDNYFQIFESELFSEIHAQEFLSRLPKSTPFDVPENYFTQSNQEIQTILFLEQIPKTLPYSVPQNYFETTTKEILSKTKSPSKTLTPLRIIYQKVALAASVLFMISLSFFVMNSKTENFKSTPETHITLETELSKISDNDIEKYIQEHQIEFDNHLSYRNIEESQIDINSLENEILNPYFKNISDEDLKNIL